MSTVRITADETSTAAATRVCPALLVSAPASGEGKTTVTAALARRHRHRGRRVRVFKTGPDFLDPLVLERASGSPVHQLDLWMGGEEDCRRRLYAAAGEADLILIEGVMGLFDGRPSSADVAARFGIPVLAVIDAQAMAQTFGAVACGLQRYRDDIRVLGVVANRVAGEKHYGMLADSVPPGLGCFGYLPREGDIELPERHLGLVQAGELDDLDVRLHRAAGLLSGAVDTLPEPTSFRPQAIAHVPRLLAGVRIGVARDAAFSFLYRANLDVLADLGATLAFFSPLADDRLPDCDALYLPGGYPELHLDTLERNAPLRASMRAHQGAGKPIVAECGGLLYLAESLTAVDGRRAEMVGLLPGHAVMRKRLAALALQEVALPEGTLRGHTFHHSRFETPLAALARGLCPNGGTTGEAVYRVGRLTASYFHAYFPSSPETVARLFAP